MCQHAYIHTFFQNKYILCTEIWCPVNVPPEDPSPTESSWFCNWLFTPVFSILCPWYKVTNRQIFQHGVPGDSYHKKSNPYLYILYKKVLCFDLHILYDDCSVLYSTSGLSDNTCYSILWLMTILQRRSHSRSGNKSWPVYKQTICDEMKWWALRLPTQRRNTYVATVYIRNYIPLNTIYHTHFGSPYVFL